MLDAVACVGPRMLLHALVGLEHHVDGGVAVGVDGDAHVVALGIFDGFVDFLLRHGEDAVILGADVRRAHAHGALGGRAVGAELDADALQPLVAEAIVNAGGLEAAERVGAANEEAGAMPQLAGLRESW